MTAALLIETEHVQEVEPLGGAGPDDQRRLDRARMRTVAVVVVGLLIGALASYGRTDAAGSLRPLLQSAALWMVAPLVLGALMRTRRGGVAAGVACALLQLGGYAGVCVLRGVSPGDHLLVVGVVVSVLGGPCFGAAGHVWRKGADAVRGLGPAALASLFIAEGGWRDLHELGATAGGLLWVAIGLAIVALTLRAWSRARWILVTLPLLAIAEIALAHFAR
jgi:hypothetical protein